MRQAIFTTLAVVTLLFFFAFFVAPATTIFVVQVVLCAIAILVVISGVVATAFFCLAIRERWRKIRVERKEADYKAKAQKYLSFKDGLGMVHLLNLKTDVVENLTAFPGTHHNGTWEKPTDEAMRAWQMVLNSMARRKSEQPIVQALPDRANKSDLDLLTIFTQPTQSYAIIAGQQVGKTYQAQQIASYWQRQRVKPIVIGPKWDAGEWVGCTMFGGEYNYQSVRRGLDIITKLAQDRHKTTNLSHKQHAIQPIFLDDWTTTRVEIDNADEFVLRATTLFASVNIILYFILHLDTAAAWGVKEVGAALKDNFIKLIIEPGYDTNGLINRRYNKGFLMRPGETKKDRQQIKLFDSVPVSQMVIDDNDNVFKRLVDGGMTRQNASQMAYGKDYAGTSHVRRCKELLGEE